MLIKNYKISGPDSVTMYNLLFAFFFTLLCPFTFIMNIYVLYFSILLFIAIMSSNLACVQDDYTSGSALALLLCL